MTKPAGFFVAMALMSLPARAAVVPERLDPTLTVVVGGGLSAGFADFHLTGTGQNRAWPVLAAQQMGTYMAVPAMRESPYTGVVNSYQPLPGLLRQVPQSGERALPFPFFALNLSVPFFRVGDSLRLRAQPKIDGLNLIPAIEGDIRQTLANAIVGGPLLVFQPPVLLTQAEYAQSLNPTLMFIQLGFEDVLDAAVGGDASKITSTSSFASDYGQLLGRMLQTDATVIVMTVPDPTETAYFATVGEVAQQYGMAPADLSARFGLGAGDLVTLGGMVEIADALRGRGSGASGLSRGSVLPAAVASSVRSAVTGYNSAIRAAVQGTRAKVFDLGDYLHQVKVAGVSSGGVSVTGAYGGGFYSEDGLYPGAAGQALIANAVLQFLNSQYGSSFQPVAVGGLQ